MSWSLGYKVVLSKSRTCLLSAAFLTSRKPKPPCFSQSVTRSSGNFCIPQVKPHLFCTAGMLWVHSKGRVQPGEGPGPGQGTLRAPQGILLPGERAELPGGAPAGAALVH